MMTILILYCVENGNQFKVKDACLISIFTVPMMG